MEQHEIDTNEPFSLSVELLRLMRWIAHNDPESLRRLVNRAISNMEDPTTFLTDAPNNGDADHAQQDITNFFMLMDNFLIESLNEYHSKSSLRTQMIPAVARIDSETCDTTLVHASIELAANKMQKNPQGNPRDILIEELIKRWKPHHENMH
jgi:hypothetical protein